MKNFYELAFISCIFTATYASFESDFSMANTFYLLAIISKLWAMDTKTIKGK